MLAAQQASVEVIGDIELFCRERRRHAPNAPFVAITGTNGKSTTTALIAHLMRVAGYDTQMGGNIGTAILSLEPPGDGRVHVIEMSSYQIDLAPSLDPSVGILLNISEDHIDRHGTLEHYAEVKERLVAGVQKQGTAIVSVDDDWSRKTADRIAQAGQRLVRVSVKSALADGIYVERDIIWRAAAGVRSEIARIGGIGSLRGLHNAQNAACASACALALGLSTETLQDGLPEPASRTACNRSAVRNDGCLSTTSKGTNADAAAHALSSFADIFWIAGGKPKLGGITSPDRILPAHPQSLSGRGSGRGICAHARSFGAARDLEDAGGCGCQCRARCGSITAFRCRGVAFAGLCVV